MGFATIYRIIRLITPLFQWFFRKLGTYNAYYSVIWKNSNDLIPIDIMGQWRSRKDNGFLEYYYSIKEVELIKAMIENDKHVLVIGDSLAGKTRAIYEAIRTLTKKHDILVPKPVDVKDIKDFSIPWQITCREKSIIFFDDISDFAKYEYLPHLLDKFNDRKAIIVATCRNGAELNALKGKLPGNFSAIFREPIEIGKISDDLAHAIAKDIGKNVSRYFDGNIGSILLPLERKQNLYIRLGENEKAILRSIKRLYLAGVYEQRKVFGENRIQLVCSEIEKMDCDGTHWRGWLNNLKNNLFIDMANSNILIEEAYLERVVADDIDILENFKTLLPLFNNDPFALYNLGSNAYDVGEFDLRKVELSKIAIFAFKQALTIWTLENDSARYSSSQNSKGLAYLRLAEVENTSGNCHEAIKAFNDALRVNSFDKFPNGYAASQNNLGITFGTLAQIENKADNCKKAIKALNEALRVYTFEKFPISYAKTKNNLGYVFKIFAEIKNKIDNCKYAIKACDEALAVYTYEDYPFNYAMTHVNRGCALRLLAEVENTSDNCQGAIESFRKSLGFFTYDKFPIQYALSKNNLGTAYGTLARVEDRGGNSKRAIKAYLETLDVYTYEGFPMNYAMTMSNLGVSYRNLAEVEDISDNCGKAINAYKEALRVRTYEDFPMDHAATLNNLGNVFGVLATAENKMENCKNAQKALKEAIKILGELGLAQDQQRIRINLEELNSFCNEESE